MTSNILQSQLWHIYMLKPVKFGDSFLFILKGFVGKTFFQGKCTAECVTSARYYMHIQLTLAHQNNCINHSKKPQIALSRLSRTQRVLLRNRRKHSSLCNLALFISLSQVWQSKTKPYMSKHLTSSLNHLKIFLSFNSFLQLFHAVILHYWGKN